MKLKEPSPDIYKIVYRLARWKTKSERYFSVFTPQEAFDDFCYVFTMGLVNSSRVYIHDMYRYDRFADSWYSEFEKITELPEYAVRKKNKINLIKQ